MFGDPCAVTSDNAIFDLVWTYNIKALDGRKRARCMLECLTAACKAFSLANAKGKGVNELVIRSLDD
jgi:hypothetical protein